ncbi:hypothetical protein CXG81DRAFT_13876, partial [Caulochytrium protostelioides]
MSFLWASPCDEAVDRATSEELPVGTEDLALNLEIADQVKSKAFPVRTAIAALKRRIHHRNPNVQLLALKLADTCVKNSGPHFLEAVATKDFIDPIVGIIHSGFNANPQVRQKCLALIQTWGIAFEAKPMLAYVPSLYARLKQEGQPFPPVDRIEASSTMIDTQTAPEWTDSDVCMRCRALFTTFNRKHHCRNCGQTFCGACSAQQRALPHHGMNEPVRVCDGCAQQLSDGKTAPRRASTSKRGDDDAAAAAAEQAALEQAIQASLRDAPSAAARPAPVP